MSWSHAAVALTGPRGSGKSSALAAWAQGRGDVHWVEDGVIPDVTEGFLAVDDLQDLGPEARSRISATLRRHHGLSVRGAVRSVPRRALDWDVELAPDLYLGLAGTERMLNAFGSAADPAVGLGTTIVLGTAAARVMLARGDAGPAGRLPGSLAPDDPVDRMTTGALTAVALRAGGHVDEARTVAERAAVVSRVHGLRSPFMLLPTRSLDEFGDAADGVRPILPPASDQPDLTVRELVVLRELSRTSSLACIAETLSVSLNTVKSQRSSLCRKLGVSSREETLARALVAGLLAG
ncbi:LuxR C-terminal-related transcriptional regulator [Georgenia sp. Z1491]|uniref:helix-turn-helix transcriptional regulator n=1 Tax=Georgenia sp. Z1491 TaxID=3416707 RepID=UPI003CEE4D83